MTSKMFSLFLNHVGEKRGEIENDEQTFSLYIYIYIYIYINSHNIGVH